REFLEVRLRSFEAGTDNAELVVIGSCSLTKPKKIRVVFFGQIDISQRRWTETLDVPGVEHFMRGQGEEEFVLSLVFERLWRHLHDGRIEVFRASAETRCDVQNEDIPIVGKRAEDRGFRPNDPRKISFKAISIEGRAAPKNNVVAL